MRKKLKQKSCSHCTYRQYNCNCLLSGINVSKQSACALYFCKSEFDTPAHMLYNGIPTANIMRALRLTLKKQECKLKDCRLVFKQSGLAKYYYREAWYDGLLCPESEAIHKGKLKKGKRSFPIHPEWASFLKNIDIC